MLKFSLFIYILILIYKGKSEELEPENERIPIELDDDDFIDPIHTRETRTNIQSIVYRGAALSDPLNLNEVNSSLTTLKYTLNNVVISNFSNCALKSTKMSLNTMDININWHCPYLSAVGQYNTNGILIILPIEGNGDFKMSAENYGILLNGKLQRFSDKDGKAHIKIKNYTIKLESGGPVVYELKNLFYGNEVLSAEAHKYINANWKLVTEFIQDPFFYAAMKLILKNVNKCLKPVPIDNLEY